MVFFAIPMFFSEFLWISAALAVWPIIALQHDLALYLHLQYTCVAAPAWEDGWGRSSPPLDAPFYSLVPVPSTVAQGP